MTLGMGIFLSAVLICVIFLFVRTREVWNWKRIFFWGLGILIGVPIVIGAGIYLLSEWNNRPQRQYSLWDIYLGDTEADVKFKKGDPTKVWDKNTWIYCVDEFGSIDQTSENPPGSFAKLPFYAIRFSKDHVSRIQFATDKQSSIPYLGGIAGFSTLDDVIAKFGEASHISRYKDQTRRIYSFDGYGVFFEFGKGEMDSAGIYDPSKGYPQFADEGK